MQRNLQSSKLRQWWSALRRERVLRLVGLFSLCLLLTVSCGGGQSTSTGNTPATGATGDGRVTIGTTLEARTLDPADAYEVFPGILLQNLGDRLYTYQPGTTQLVPQLATALPEVSEDGLTYTIPLRTDVKFHDGEPLNAEAVVFSIKRFMENEGRATFLLADRVESIEATGENEIAIKLNQPFSAFPSLLAFYGTTPVSPKAYEIGAGKFKPNDFVGTGPYKLAQFSPDTIRLDPNPDYWGEKPANQGVDIQIIASPANLYNTFKTGGIDVAYQTLDPDQIRDLVKNAQSSGWQVIEAGSNVVNYLVLNQKSKPLDDVRVRQAIAAMIDRELLNERVFQGQAEPLYSLLSTSSAEYKPVFKDQYGDGNMEKAKALLTEAGISASNPLTLEIWYSSSSTKRNLVANTLKAAIEKEMDGMVVIEPKSVEAATLFDNLDKGTYPSVLLDWYPDYFDSDTFIEPFMSCEKGSATTGCESGQSQTGGSFYYSEKANQLIQQQRSEQDPAARKQQFEELQDLLAADVPYIPLWQDKDYVFAQNDVEGVEIQPSQQFFFWQIKK
ncbi:peptide ABC transporter substrate-binding protein [Leptolyngbya sp. NK1-12]|uniref:Peptide ABC transporter substrate-binding protein n=2 Tax=Leptolyngbya sp. NK1-12 TaxID=2547451 RepID=A0AA96WJF5_9CYAN|nr:peptide ABC transporter substrate-binding protein [Leptolyngbya sp. NK1-12]